MTITPKDADGLRALAEMAAKGHVVTSYDVSRGDTQSTGWRPIETAPMDGSLIMLYADCEGWEDCGKSRCIGWHDGHSWSVFGPAFGELEKPRGRSRQRIGTCNPTHWMPLPGPPIKGE